MVDSRGRQHPTRRSRRCFFFDFHERSVEDDFGAEVVAHGVDVRIGRHAVVVLRLHRVRLHCRRSKVPLRWRIDDKVLRTVQDGVTVDNVGIVDGLVCFESLLLTLHHVLLELRARIHQRARELRQSRERPCLLHYSNGYLDLELFAMQTSRLDGRVARGSHTLLSLLFGRSKLPRRVRHFLEASLVGATHGLVARVALHDAHVTIDHRSQRPNPRALLDDAALVGLPRRHSSLRFDKRGPLGFGGDDLGDLEFLDGSPVQRGFGDGRRRRGGALSGFVPRLELGDAPLPLFLHEP